MHADIKSLTPTASGTRLVLTVLIFTTARLAEDEGGEHLYLTTTGGIDSFVVI